MLVNHAIHDLIEAGARTPQTRVDGEWQTLNPGTPGGESDLSKSLHRDGQTLVKGLCLLCDVGIEEGLSHYHERQLQHFLRDIDPRAILPDARLLLGSLDHRYGIACDAL